MSSDLTLVSESIFSIVDSSPQECPDTGTISLPLPVVSSQVLELLEQSIRHGLGIRSDLSLKGSPVGAITHVEVVISLASQFSLHLVEVSSG